MKTFPVLKYAMKVHRGVEVQLHTFLTSALDGSEYPASRPTRLASRERTPIPIR
jgi:hypothetical protein